MISLIIGLCAGVLCTLSFLPQVMRIYKTKRVGDLSLTTFSMLSVGIFLWLIYGILTGSLPIMLTNAAMLILSLLIVAMIVKYK
ncbi:MAG: SemiSWEET transporter [Candidatus Omnitrophica bacterium]|nr:SemiSWEET transporter [Candidatus Omnitrophota bacterium]